MSYSISAKPPKHYSGDFNLKSMQIINKENHKEEKEKSNEIECHLDRSIYNTSVKVVID